MMQRYLTLDAIPELRSEPSNSEKGLPEIEILVPVDVYWELCEIIEKIRYAKTAGMTTTQYWHTFAHIVRKYVVTERDRIWFSKNVKF